MGWASRYIEALGRGESVSFRPRGHSMRGTIDDGQLVTVEPLGSRCPAKGDVVLCRVKGREYVHLVKGVAGVRFQIGNARGGINGWIGRRSIFGIVVRVED